jgi:hypothetical protein
MDEIQSVRYKKCMVLAAVTYEEYCVLGCGQ